MRLDEAVSHAAVSVGRRDAEMLVLHVLREREPERDRAWLLAHGDETLSETEREALGGLVERRSAHEPLQYLTGVQEFYGLRLHVTRDVLIPRPETERLVESVIAWAATRQAPQRILDVGTGSGAIALALAQHLPAAEIAEIYASDISPAALEVAKKNASALGLMERMRFMHGDLLGGVSAAIEGGRRFDAVVSNPPYVPLGDAANMQPEVVGHEPHMALFAGEDGLDVYRRLIPAAHAALREGGLLAMEIGFGQREALTRLLEGWSEIRFVDDYAGIPRVALAERA